MKKMKLLVAILALIISVTVNAQNKNYTYYSITEAVNNSDDGREELLLDKLSNNDVKQLDRKANKLEHIAKLYLTNIADDIDYNQLIKVLNQLPFLEEVHFKNADLTRLPENLNSLGLEALVLEDLKPIDYKILFTKLATINGLSKLSIFNTSNNLNLTGLAAMAELEQLVVLMGDGYDYNSLAAELSGMPILADVTISCDRIENLPEKLTDVKNIYELRLRDKSKQERQEIEHGHELFLVQFKGGRKLILTHEYVDTKKVYDVSTISELKRQFPEAILTKLESGTGALEGVSAGIEKGNPKVVPAIKPKNYNFKKNALVVPPIIGAEPQGKVYQVSANKLETFYYPSGSKVTIPANCFVDKNNKPVNGEVDIFYCEYSNPFDFVTSGIPMTYDSAGEVNHFESAGMFQIQASCEGEEVFVAPGKEVKVNLVTDNTDSNFNFYELNPDAGGWVSEPQTFFMYTYKYLPIDYTKFDERFYDLNYFTNFNKKTTVTRIPKSKAIAVKKLMPTKEQYVKEYHRRSLLPIDRNIYMRSAFKVKKLPKVKGDSSDIIRFKIIPRNFNQKKYKTPQHLRYFVNRTFIYKGELDRFEFYRAFSRMKRYQDFRIFYDKGDNSFKFRLKSFEGFVDIEAYTFVDNPETIISGKEKASVRKFERCFERYERKLDDLRTSFNNSVTKQTPEVDFRANLTRMSVDANATDLVSRTISLTNMGVYNCDRIMKMENPVNVLAKFKLPNEEDELNVSLIYVIDKKANGMYTYPKDNLVMDPENTKCLILLTEDNKIAYVKREDVKAGYTGRESDFVAHLTTTTDRFELKKQLGL